MRQAAARDARRLWRDGTALGLILVVTQVLTYVQMYTMQIAGARAMADLRSAIFSFFQRLQLRYYDRTPVGRLVTRATNDVDAVSELFASGALNAMGDAIALIGIVVMMLVLDWRLSIVSFLPFRSWARSSISCGNGRARPTATCARGPRDSTPSSTSR